MRNIKNICAAGNGSSGAGIFLFKIGFGKTAFAGLSVLAEQVAACLVHGLNYHIKGNLSGMGQEIGKAQRIDGAHRRNGITLNARNLHQSADWITG